MKGKIVVILLYIFLALAVCAVGVYWAVTFAFDDIINCYRGGILIWIFALIILAGIVLPILKYRKHKQKWVLPIVLSAVILITPIFCNGILKFAEDSLKTYSKEKWEDNEHLRVYMLHDLETRYLNDGRTQEYVKNLLGEPDFISGDDSQCFEYYAGVDFMETIVFYVQFENGLLAETGTRVY